MDEATLAPFLVAWIFEGIPERVAWLGREGEKLLADRPTASAPTAAASDLRTEEAEAALGRLAALAEPISVGVAPGAGASAAAAPIAAPTVDDVGIARIAVPPARASAVTALLPSNTGVWADVATGLVTIRFAGLRDAPKAAGPFLDALVQTAAAHGGSARLLHLPPAVRADWRRDLTPDRLATFSARIFRPFDPSGVFGPDRIREDAS